MFDRHTTPTGGDPTTQLGIPHVIKVGQGTARFGQDGRQPKSGSDALSVVSSCASMNQETMNSIEYEFH